MPESDRLLRFLLGLALAQNTGLDRILIVNTGAGQALYGPMFQQLPKRVRVEHLVTKFKDAVAGGDLQRVLGQVYDQKEPVW